jgi:hypothetical protein
MAKERWGAAKGSDARHQCDTRNEIKEAGLIRKHGDDSGRQSVRQKKTPPRPSEERRSLPMKPPSLNSKAPPAPIDEERFARRAGEIIATAALKRREAGQRRGKRK